MGSLNQDGSKISQSRESVRNVGGANIRSADRVESEVIRERSPEAASDDLGTNADLTTSQYSTVSLSETQKITESVDETLISRESDREDFTPDPNHQPREWYGLATASSAGGGAKYLEVVTMSSGNSITLASESGQVIIVKGTGPRTIMFPLTPNPTDIVPGYIYDIKDGDGTASSGNITVDGNGSNIDGSSTFALDVNYASYTFVYNGTEWNLI